MLKHLAKRIFNALDLEVHRKSGKRSTMTQSLYHLSSLGFKPEVIIDVGTAYGTEQLLEVYPDVRYLWIEALKEFEPTIQQSHRPSAQGNKTTFNGFRSPDLNSKLQNC